MMPEVIDLVMTGRASICAAYLRPALSRMQ
jgi:hypothetical protein